MGNLPETTPIFNESAPKRRRWWLWVLPLVLILGLLGGAFAVRQIENSHWEAGQAAIASGEWETAVTEFSTVIYQWPSFLRQHTIEATALRGVAYFQQEKWLAALPDFDEALLLDPNQIDIFAYRAMIHFEDEAWELAMADAEIALAQPELVPNFLRAQLHAKIALLPDDLIADDERETAVADALALSSHLPEETVAELYTMQAENQFGGPDSGDVLTAINQALALEAELTRSQQGRLLPQKAQLLAEAGRWPDALAAIAEALSLRNFFDEPTQAALYDIRGQIYFAQGDWEKGVTEAELALELDDSLAWPTAALAWQAYRMADFEAAGELAEAALALDDSIGLAYTVQAALLTWQGDVYGALEALDVALSHNPEDVEALALKVYNLREINASEELLAATETAVSANPNAPATKWAEAMAAANQYDFSLTFALLNQAIALDNGRPELYFYRALYYPFEGDLDKSIEDFETSLELNPEFGPAIVGLAYAHADRYDFSDLERVQEEMLEKWPNWYASHVVSGFYYEQVVKDNDLALAAYTKAIEMLPERPRSYSARGYLYYSINEYEQAEADFEATLALDAENALALGGLADIAEVNKDDDLQLDYLLQAVDVSKNGRTARLDLAFYYLFTVNEVEKAWEIVNRLIAEDETDASAYTLIALAHLIEGNNKEALETVNHALDLNPYLILSYFIKSDALLNSERYGEAIKAAENIWELEPDAFEVHQQLFFIALNQGDIAEAERQYLFWLDAMPEYESDYTVQANMELNLGKFEEAIASFTAALAEDEENESLLFGRAIAYLNLQDGDGYKADFAQILAVGSTIEILSDAEYWLAVDNGLLVAVDGLATFTDEVAGYQISYPAEWERPLLAPDDDTLFIAFIESPSGIQSVNIFRIEGAFGLTLNDIATIVTENVRQSAGIEMVDSYFGEMANMPAFIYDYEFTVQDGLGENEVLLGRQYIVLIGSTVWFITVESNEALFDDSLPIFEEIIGSVRFLE